MTIFTMHGVTEEKNRKFVHRNLMDARKFSHILRSRELFVSVADALASKGDALTIDDSTRAGLLAAKIAVEYGHKVTLYVNPEQIINQVPYPFCRLNVLLDQIVSPVHFYNKNYDVSERCLLRKEIKSQLLKIKYTKDQHDFLDELFFLFDIQLTKVPEHLYPPTLKELQNISEQGVTIGNHGWSHMPHDVFTLEESLKEIQYTSRWISENLTYYDIQTFAVPNGEFYPQSDNRKYFSVIWLLADSSIPIGQIEERVVNRESLYAHYKNS